MQCIHIFYYYGIEVECQIKHVFVLRFEKLIFIFCLSIYIEIDNMDKLALFKFIKEIGGCNYCCLRYLQGKGNDYLDVKQSLKSVSVFLIYFLLYD